jgi:chromosome segregation ATPase
VSARLPLFPHTTMGLKDMFRSAGGKAHKGSPRTSAKSSHAGSSPKGSRRSSLDRSEAVSVSSAASGTSAVQQAEDGQRIAALEQELSKSRWEAMKMHERIAELETKVEAGQGAEQTQKEQEQRRALEERNKQLREKVRDLQEEVERLQDGRSSVSSYRVHDHEDEQSHQSQTSQPASSYTPRDMDGMAARIKELEAQLEEADKQHTDVNFDGMAARIKSLEAMLEETKEDADELMRERDQLREALQDAGASLRIRYLLGSQ